MTRLDGVSYDENLLAELFEFCIVFREFFFLASDVTRDERLGSDDSINAASDPGVTSKASIFRRNRLFSLAYGRLPTQQEN